MKSWVTCKVGMSAKLKMSCYSLSPSIYGKQMIVKLKQEGPITKMQNTHHKSCINNIDSDLMCLRQTKHSAPLPRLHIAAARGRLVVTTAGLRKGKLMGHCFVVYFDCRLRAASVTVGGSTACGHQRFAEAAVLSLQRSPVYHRW